jgi:hypothetical protein
MANTRHQRTNFRRSHLARRFSLESLENRSLLAVQPISLAGSSFFGASADGYSSAPSVSNDGQIVAFASTAPNLVPSVTTGYQNNIYVRNESTGVVSLVSVNKSGTNAANAASSFPTVSGDGRFVMFQSSATDLTSLNVVHAGQQLYVRNLTTGVTTLVSVNKDGTDAANGGVTNAEITPDGRYVVFEDNATDLVAGRTKNNVSNDVYVRDLVAGTTNLVSVNKNGTGTGDAESSDAVISDDGRFVAFLSNADDLVANDTNKATDVFMRDMKNGTTSLVSINRFGTASGNTGSGGFLDQAQFAHPTLAISSDGRYVTFNSTADDLTTNDSNNIAALYRRDLSTATTVMVTVNQAGTNASNGFGVPYKFSVTPDGRYVAFQSEASDLVPNNAKNFWNDIYVRDIQNNTTTLVSINSASTAGGNTNSQFPFISDDGRYVVFQSDATNLVNGDNNNAPDIFVRDLQAKTTSLVSINAQGTASGNGASSPDKFLIYLNGYRFSSNGHVVAFESDASDLVANDNNTATDVFARDLTASTTLVSQRSPSLPAAIMGNATSQFQSVSADGRYVAFLSGATDIVSNQFSYPNANVFVRDRQTGTNILVSANKDHTAAANNTSDLPLIASGGRYVFFRSGADNLVANELSNPDGTIWRYDLTTGTLVQAVIANDGKSGPNAPINAMAVSSDGRFVVYTTTATNLVTGYTLGHQNQIFGDLYETDIQTGKTVLISVDTTRKTGANEDIVPPALFLQQFGVKSPEQCASS